MPGLAFAVCTAALPLLQLRDPNIATILLEALKAALPLVSEPSPSSCYSSSTQSKTSTIDVDRIQHLLDRTEQILTFFPLDTSYLSHISSLSPAFEYYSIQAPAPSKFLKKVDRVTELFEGEESLALGSLRDTAFNATFIKIVVQILAIVPPDYVVFTDTKELLKYHANGTSDTTNSMAGCELVLGERTVHLLHDIYCLWSAEGHINLINNDNNDNNDNNNNSNQQQQQQYCGKHSHLSDIDMNMIRNLLQKADLKLFLQTEKAISMIRDVNVITFATSRRFDKSIKYEPDGTDGGKGSGRGSEGRCKILLSKACNIELMLLKKNEKILNLFSDFSPSTFTSTSISTSICARILGTEKSFDLPTSIAMLFIISIASDLVDKQSNNILSENTADATAILLRIFSSGSVQTRLSIVCLLLELGRKARPKCHAFSDSLSKYGDSKIRTLLHPHFMEDNFLLHDYVNEDTSRGDMPSRKSVSTADLFQNVLHTVATPTFVRTLLIFAVLNADASPKGEEHQYEHEQEQVRGHEKEQEQENRHEHEQQHDQVERFYKREQITSGVNKMNKHDNSCQGDDTKRLMNLSTVLLDCALDHVVTMCEEERDSAVRNDSSYADTWKNLLPYLKIVEWSSLPSATGRPSNIAMLVQLLEDTNQQHAHHDDISGRTMVLGLFHSSALVRSSCALRLRHELAGLSAPSEALVIPSGGGGDRDLFEQEMDPFPPKGIIQLSPIVCHENRNKNENGNEIGNYDGHYDNEIMSKRWDDEGLESIATHTDIRRLIDIALSNRENENENEDEGGRVFILGSDSMVHGSALRQLRGILERDRHLTATVDPSWCITVTIRMLKMLEIISSSIELFLKGRGVDTLDVGEDRTSEWTVPWSEESNKLKREKRILSGPHLDDVLANRKFCVELAATIKLFITIFSFVRSSFSFDSSSLSQFDLENDNNRDSTNVPKKCNIDSVSVSKISPRVLLQRCLRSCTTSSTTSLPITYSSSSSSSSYNRKNIGGQVRSPLEL